MGEKKPEPLDFVKDFQEYLTQQTHHVNMISGSVSGDKEAEALQGGRFLLIPLNNSFFIHVMFAPIFPSGCEGKLGVALESLQGRRDLT